MSNNELSPESRKFIDASRRMTAAWLKMVETRQVRIYMELGDDRKTRSRGKNQLGTEHIIAYQEALRDLISSTEK